MKKTLFTIFLLLGFSANIMAQNWDNIISSKKYYYGVGYGTTWEEAKNMALSSLIGQIAVNVSSDFEHLIDETNINGKIDHETKVLNCIKTYSQATLTNVTEWSVGEPPECTMRCYMERAEMERIFENRIIKAKEYIKVAEEYLVLRKIDSALKYYYWAYSLIRSVQFPNEVKDENGNVLVVRLPMIIENIIDNVKIDFDSRTDEYVNIVLTYKGEPVSSIEFEYNNGQELCSGKGKDGRGMIEVRSTHEGKIYHINVEYEFKNHVRGDVELESVLNVVPKKHVASAAKKVFAVKSAKESKEAEKAIAVVAAQQIKPLASQMAKEAESYKVTMEKVLDAVNTRRYSDVANLKYFTLDGLEVFNALISYGTGRVVGIPKMHYLNGLDSCVVARGLQMSFSFNKGRKTFVEDVVFYFDRNGKIDNISFGLGMEVTNEILNRDAQGWGNDAREILLEFLENYKTAYALERLDYIRSIFSDDAQIITGKVLKTKPGFNPAAEKSISIEGQQAIEYTHLTKHDYMERLKKVFASNEFININFSRTSVRKITKITDKEKFVIQLAQEYNSSVYSDKGYLLLLVDITNADEPLIEIRTWQPDEINLDNVFHEGMFYTN